MDISNWLFEPSYPSMRDWALMDLEGKESVDAEVLAIQDEIMESPQVEDDTRRSRSMWLVGWGTRYVSPKVYRDYSLPADISRVGCKRTPAIERGIEHMFRFQRRSGHFLPDLPTTEKGKASSVKDGCCFDGNILYYLIHFGYLDDPRTRRLIDFNVTYYDDQNAGWRCRSYPTNAAAVFPKNCYMGATKMLRALSMIPQKKRVGEIQSIIDREVESILRNGVYRYLRNPDGTSKDKAGWKRFGFPLFYQSDALEVLDTLSRLGVRDNRMTTAIDLVLGAQQPDGRWLLENTFNGKMWVDIEEKWKPSKWITLRALRTLKRMGYTS